MSGKAHGEHRPADPPAVAPSLGATSYWIIVKRGKEDLKAILEIAFKGRQAFTVIEDRRLVARRVRRGKERRHSREYLRLQDFLVAERQDLTQL